MAGGIAGHVALGFAFLFIGLWHLFNCIRLHLSLHPNSYLTRPWWPVNSRGLQYTEPVIIMLTTVIFSLMELFHNRTPLSPDGTIPSVNLPHFEHSVIAMSFFVYALFAIVLDKVAPPGPARHGLAHFLQAVAFSQQLLILHLHSTDHMGIEGQYHWLLQIVTFVALVTTLMAIGYPRSFVCSFVRAFSVIFQGVWLIVLGCMLWTPRWLPKGCFLKSVAGRDVVLCNGDPALERGKSLVNMQFGLYLIVVTVFTMFYYLAMVKLYLENKVVYESLRKDEEQEGGDHYSLGDNQEKHTLCVSRMSLPI